MAKVKQKPKQKKKTEKDKQFHFPLRRTNFLILTLGVIVLIIGYIFMAIPDNPDAFLTRTLSPILLVAAYLIIIPIGLFYREKQPQQPGA
jgi:O-antigen/teichoic acid export membrane protein